ncbi:3-hydroxyisobutyrate dehydrogenase [Methylacidimicrobium cyclopophantes]|uniref:3-hydroxyisobutyrate dehydrogenase n=1 Tax=Methylacidimicrobium cyclopophantes TaxID=1041766 RepID=A0A5E6MEA5_9BACT|nr:NAD(P)-dependent oxidoreductase [Methylacidimicrobium cyclopophantes]VVM07434.1 3-hydroxyisobutyrate dehydrogenase [Methylacidimicrobium cyclopophantes]
MLPTSLALFGTGLLGHGVARRFLASGLSVTVYNRTRAKAEDLGMLGARLSSSAQEAVEASELLILCLSDAAAIRQTVFSHSCLSRLSKRILCQMGTIGPEESQEIARLASAQGARYLEAPLLGNGKDAEEGRAQVMIGADPKDYEPWQELLGLLGRCLWIGPVGKAAALKLALNQLIAAETAAFALSLGFVRRSGVPIESFLQILRESSLYCPTFDKKLARMWQRNFGQPSFSVRLLLKDIDLFLGNAERLGLRSDALEGAREIVREAMESGRADLDYSALIDVIDPLSSLGTKPEDPVLSRA